MNTEKIYRDPEEFYRDHQDHIEELWAEHISQGEWGSGEDKITPNNDMFKEFVYELMENH